MNTSVATHSHDREEPIDRDDTIGRLAKALIRQAAATQSPQDVLLDVELDGFRCIIVRTEPKPKPPMTHERLSPRETEIARMVAEGHPNKTIASELDLSTWTVNTYLRRIFAKLGVTSRAAMVARLMRGK